VGTTILQGHGAFQKEELFVFIHGSLDEWERLMGAAMKR